MSTRTLRRPRRRALAGLLAGATVISAVGLGALGAAPATADSGTTQDGATATVPDAVAIGGVIHIEGTGWKFPAGGGSVIGVKLDSGMTEPQAGPPTNPGTGQPATGLGLWAAVEADATGAFSLDLPFPTPSNSSPAVNAADWAIGTTHHVRLLSGSLKQNDQARTLAVNFTVADTLTASATTAATNAVTVAVSGSRLPAGEVLSVAEGATALKWTVSSGRTSTVQDTYTVPAAGTLSAGVVYAAGAKRAGQVTLHITGDQGTDKTVSAVVPPSASFDPGPMVGSSGTLTLGNLVGGATLSSVKLGDATIGTNLTANAEGVVTTPYSIAADASSSLSLVIAQATPEARTFTLTQPTYPNEVAAGAGRFTLTSTTADQNLYQGFYQSAYSAKADALYVTASDRGTGNGGFLYKLDPDTLAVEASYAFVDHDGFTKTGGFGVGVDDVNGNVWVSNTGSAAVAIYRESDLSLVKQFPANTISHPRDVVYDPKTNRIFVSSASESSSAAADGYISVFEAADNDGDGTPYEKITDIQTGKRDVFNPVSLSLDNGTLVSPGLQSNNVAVIDTTELTFKLVEIEGLDGVNGTRGSGGSGIAYDAGTNRIYVASQTGNEVVIADATTGAVIKEVPTGRGALNAVIDHVHKFVYVSNFAGTSVSVLDLDGNKVASLPIATANHVSVDGQGNAFAVDKATPNRVWRISPRLETVGGVEVLDPTATSVTGKAATTPIVVDATYGEPIHLAGTNFRTAAGTSGSTIAVKSQDVQGAPTVATIEADTTGSWSADVPFPADWVVGDTQNLRLLSGSLKAGDTPRSIAVKVRVAPASTGGRVTVTGSATVGATVSAAPAGWPTGATLGYQWARDGVAIARATGATYRVAPADAKHRLSVTVTSKHANYRDGTATSPAVTVKPGTLVAHQPKIKGTAQVGKKLTAVPGTWSTGTKLTYVWKAGGKVVKGAKGKSLKLTKALRGKRITVTVTGTKAGYATASKTSAKTKAVKAKVVTKNKKSSKH